MRTWRGVRVAWRALAVALAMCAARPDPAAATVYYVRQTVGDDSHDGRSPETAWQSFSRLERMLRPGDTVYVGPGFYRDDITIMADGTKDKPIVLVGDPSGRATGDPPGPLLLAGSDPVDESAFEPTDEPHVFRLKDDKRVLGVVEMDGTQKRYVKATITYEYHQQHMEPAAVVAKLRSSFEYDDATKTLLIHTSDERPPKAHEIELMHRLNGVNAPARAYVVVTGFTFRHFGDAGVNFFMGSANDAAIGNVSYGSRQGIRVYGATDVLIQGNTLFLNENSGVYFARGSTGSKAVGNVAYDNVKGVRWSSESNGALVLDNVLFDNTEAGIALEGSHDHFVAGNVSVGNREAQIRVLESSYRGEFNCFASRAPSQLLGDLWAAGKHTALAPYRQASGQEMSSWENDCRPLPKKIDVHRLHAESQAYLEKARKILQKQTGAGKAKGRTQS